MSVPEAFRNRTSWYLGISAYWFATSFKWFIMFLLLGPHVATIVPGGEKNQWWGLIVAVGAVEAMIGPAIFGYLSDRCTSRFGRRRPFVAVGAAMTAIALLLMGNADTIWALLLSYLLLQISDDVATGPYSALIPDLVPEEHRGRASGIMGLLNLLANIAAVGAAFVLGDIVKIFLFVAVLHLVCAAIVLVTVRERPMSRTLPSEDRLEQRSRISFVDLMRGWLKPFRHADFRWVWLTRFLNQLGFYMILIYVANYLGDVVQRFTFGPLTVQDPKEAALLIALGIALAGAFSSLYAGRWADRIGRKKVIFISGWIMFAALVPFALIPAFHVILPLSLLFGLGYGAYQASNWALVADVLPSQEDVGMDMGIWQMSIAAPQVFSGAAGLLVDRLNAAKFGLGYHVIFLVASLVFLASTQLIGQVKGST